MRLLDLFTGIGGFSLAFKRIFPDGEIIGFSEIDKYAISVYKNHFKGVKELGSVTDIRPEDLPDFDIATFGFPCQDMSIAGKRAGLEGERSSLFYQAIRIIKAKRPPLFIFENVKGLFSSRKGQDFIAVLQAITDIGYDGQWQLLNTKWFLPQNRERIYFVGHLRGTARPEVFPIGESHSKCNYEQRELTEKQIAQAIQCPGNSCGTYKGMNAVLVSNSARGRRWEGRADGMVPPLRANHSAGHNDLIRIGTVGNDGEGTRMFDPNGLARTIMNGGGMGAKTGLYVIPTVLAPQTSYGNGERKVEYKEQDIVPTIRATQHKSGDNQPKILSNSNIRRLTPVECERLQGFPDGWTEGISDTQRYKCLGNSISVPIPEEIFRRLRNTINQ